MATSLEHGGNEATEPTLHPRDTPEEFFEKFFQLDKQKSNYLKQSSIPNGDKNTLESERNGSLLCRIKNCFLLDKSIQSEVFSAKFLSKVK
jgi:hypothetical protein